jgi:hypothetical protein
MSDMVTLYIRVERVNLENFLWDYGALSTFCLKFSAPIEKIVMGTVFSNSINEIESFTILEYFSEPHMPSASPMRSAIVLLHRKRSSTFVPFAARHVGNHILSSCLAQSCHRCVVLAVLGSNTPGLRCGAPHADARSS